MRVADFINFLTDALPNGEVYLFGGILRDLALLGRKGFSSDIDLVVEGEWSHCIGYLNSLGAKQNKFGGYRLEVDGWPIDIWNAAETWAVRQGYVRYKGIASLTETVILNWDAILMNWKTRAFIYRPGYFDTLRARRLDVVFEQNPNPIGMAVRVFRHLCVKDARSIGVGAAEYLSACTGKYSFELLTRHELRSYGASMIDPAIYELFDRFRKFESLDIRSRFDAAAESLRREGVTPSTSQLGWSFDAAE